MRFFALETDINAIISRYCNDAEGECKVLLTHYHGLSFLFAILREILVTIVFAGIGFIGWWFGWPALPLFGVLGIAWIFFVFFNVLRAYIDWAYDFIFVTTDKVVLVDQTSIFRQEIKPIHLENIGSISTATQFWGIFPFGRLSIHLKEGLGGDTMTKSYVPHVADVGAAIAHAVTVYQRRIAGGGAGEGQ